jgi:uncharacterized protein (TIGR03067 family)
MQRRTLTRSLVLLLTCAALSGAANAQQSQIQSLEGRQSAAKTSATFASTSGAAMDDQALLQGTWQCVQTFKDGKAVPDYVGVKGILKGNTLTWVFPARDGRDVREEGRFAIDPRQKHFDWYYVSEGPSKLHRRLYAVDRDTLHMADNFGKGGRPASFDQAIWRFVCKRVEAQPAGAATGPRVAWGTVINPDGDCTISQANDKVTMSIPAGVHNIWYGRPNERQRFNAPRVLQEIEGDFVAQVKVTADWNPDIPASEYYYNGAGLLVWDSEEQYVRMERNTYQRNTPPTGIFCYTNALYDRNERRIYPETTARNDFYKGRSTWLRIDRAGDKLTTAISHDGMLWSDTAILMTEFPEKVLVGIHVNVTSPRDFVVEFAEFNIARK